MALATTGEDGPEVATSEYLVVGEQILFSTSTDYRKYQNLLRSPRIAGVVTKEHDKTLQFEGDVVQQSGAEADAAKAKLLELDPDFINCFDDTTCFFIIQPIWMRFTDYTVTPTRKTEFKL